MATQPDGSLHATFRETMAGVCTAVTVITAEWHGLPYGTTVSAFTLLSMTPPMAAIALDRNSDLLGVIRDTGTFGVNVLSAGQASLAVNFARKGGTAKFTGIAWHTDTGLPRLPGATGFLACRVARLVDAGDHLAVLADVLAADNSPGAPLTYHKRAFGTHTSLACVRERPGRVEQVPATLSEQEAAMTIEHRPQTEPLFTDVSVPVTSDVRLHVRHRTGSASPPFLLVHGETSNARVWDEVADHLAGVGHPVYAIDLRGHGESDEPADEYGVGTAVADLAAVCAALSLRGAVVAGHSWGGHVALRLAADHPELVAGLALVDGGWNNLPTAGITWEQCAAMHGQRSAGAAHGIKADEMRAWLRAIHPRWSSVAIEANLAAMRVEPDGTLTRRPGEPQCISMLRSLWNDTPTRDYPAITMPVLMLPAAPSGDQTSVELVRKWVAAAEAAMPSSTTKWYPDAEHYLQAQHPEQLARDLLDLARAAIPSGKTAI